MATAGYYNYDGVWLAASAAPLKTIWGTGTATMTAGAGPVKLADSGKGQMMIGGAGDDTFVVGSANDTVVAGSAGVDTVVASVNYILPTGVQNLTLNGTWTNVVGVGNDMANIITADRAGETIIGGGGDDVLVSAGGDTFAFTPGSGKDVIVGFHAGAASADIVRLGGYGFTSFAAVQGAMTQMGSDVVLKLSANDLIDFKNTTVSAFTAGNFQLQINDAGKAMSFDDEFNSLSLYNPTTKTGTWKTSYAWGSQTSLASHTIINDGEQEIYVDPSFAGSGSTALGINPFSISNGVLSITAGITPTADKSSLWNYSYTSGLISSEKTFSQTYGYFEIKAEMPATTTGFWPAFWLMPADGSYSSELDVFEEVGDKANTVYNTVHYFPTGSTTKTATSFATYVPNMMTGFHTYGVLWTPTTITWYVDGAAVQSVATPPGMNKPMYMVANMAVGGNWPGSPASASQFPSALQIDYIHAYTLAQVQSASPITQQNPVYAANAGHSLSVDAAHGVLVGDTDPNGLTLNASLAANGGPSHGTLTLNANGAFTYTPNAGFAGADSFTYIAGDGASNSAPTTVTLNIGATAPTAKAEAYGAAAGATVSIDAAHGVLANDVDNNGLTLTAALAQNGAPAHGTVSLNADGSFTYTPTLGFAGTDSFTYVASDSLSTGTPTTVTLNVAATAPTSKAEAYAASAGGTINIDAAHGVLANDTDANGLTLTAAMAQNGAPAHGTVSLNADGSFTYTPTLGFAGTDSFTYVASDSLSTGTPTTVTLNVTAQGVVTQAASFDAHAGQNLIEDAAHGVLAGQTDPNGLSLTAALAANGGPSHGTLALNADGSFTYTPTLGFAGTDSFTYVAGDSLVAGTPTTVTLNVLDPPPTAQSDSYATTDAAALGVTAAQGVLANDVDNNGLTLTASLADKGGPQHGTLALNADGSFTYTPTVGFVGSDSFTYLAVDSLSSTPATVTITVAPQNIVGGAGNDVYSVYNSADQITVASGTPNESVIGYASYALPANIQNLTVVGAGLTATANALNDTLTSQGGPNILVGGTGIDTFYVNNVGDVVSAPTGQNADVIISSVSYALGGNLHVLRLSAPGLTATGSDVGGNYLTSMNGGDTLIGGAKGNDFFTVAHSNDVIVVAAGTPNETVDAYSSFILPANVQNLVGKGAGAVTLVGNTMDNIISANAGADILTGGGGADIFVMAPGQKVETITDFTASDKIDITAYLAKGLNPSFHDFGTYSTVSFSSGETIKLLGVHAGDLHLSGHYVI